jgi:hypothetical protein
MNRIYSQLATRMLGLGTAGLLLVAVGCGKAKPEKSVSGKDQPGVSATAGKAAKPGRPAVADASLTAVERAARDKMAKLAAKQGAGGPALCQGGRQGAAGLGQDVPVVA